MSTTHVLIFLAIFVGGSFVYGAKVADLPARVRARRTGGRHTRRCRPPVPASDRWARIATGGSVRFDDRTIQRVKERAR